MRGTWDALSLAALALCSSCESFETNNIAAAAGSTGDASSVTSTSTGFGADAGTGGTGASPGTANTDTNTNTSANSSTSLGGSSKSTTTNASASSTTTAGGAGTGGQPSSPVDETHACLEYVLGFCEFNARCSGGPESVIPCFEASSVSCPDLLFAPGSTRTVDSTFTCADAWRALACDLTTPECATAGTLVDGEACVSGIQCASRLCSGNAATCGSCVPSADRGEPCDETLGPQCGPGLHCHRTDAVCVLATEPWADDPEIGEECDPSGSGCYPLACEADGAGVYRCQPYPTLGEDCSEPVTCAVGDSYCDVTLVCLALPASGQPCGLDGFTGAAQWCAEGLICDGALDPPRCLPTPAAPGVGEPCDGACQAGLSCRCTDGGTCDSKICQWARLQGESCTGREEACLMGECVEGICVVTEMDSTFAALCGQ